jgi:crossover junction endodeoxyribonuclease RusA
VVRVSTYRSPAVSSTSNSLATAGSIPAALPSIRLRLESRRPVNPPLAPRAVVTPESLSLTLPIPPSVNHQYTTVNGRRLLSAQGRTYKSFVSQQVLLALSSSGHRTMLLRRLQGADLALSITFFFTSRLRRDVDGGLKIAQDALCEGLGVNDNRIVETHLYKNLDRQRPRIEVSLSTVVGALPGSTRQK